MEIAVTASSPLGQYLAELDAEADGGGESLAQLLSAPRPVARMRPRRNGSAQVSSGWSWLQVVEWLRRRVELVAVRRLLPELCAFHPTIRDELRQTAGSDAAVFAAPSKSLGGSWRRHVAVVQVLSGANVVVTDETRRSIVVAGGALMAAVLVGAGRESVGVVFLLQTMGWIVAVAVFVGLGLELSVRLLLAWYARRSERLVGSLSTFVAALEKFNEVYADSLTLMKRAELASRGYRLGAGLLPPIGRLEASSVEIGGSEESAAMSAARNQLRCLPLRRKLRTLTEQLQIRASSLVKEGTQTTGEEARDRVKGEEVVDERAPSLLLTALAKQHNRSVLLLENAVHTVLVRNMAYACSSRDDARVGWGLFRTLGSQRFTVEQLVGTLSAWVDDLEAWYATSGPLTLLASASETKVSDQQQQEQHVTSSNASDCRLKGVATPLHELRSASETLTALVVAAQHELLSADSAAERLTSSRDVIRSMVQQLQEAWGNYDIALSTLTGRADNPQDTGGAEADEDEEDRDSKPIAALASSSVPAPEDPNCTVVFTGTSIDDGGFDLQALLKQQEADAAATSSGPTPHFVRELQDVLAHRQTRAQPGLTKQVDHDPPVRLTPASDARNEAPPPQPPAADAMFALPRAPPRGRPRRPTSVPPALPSDNALSGVAASAFNLELQALLQRAQPSQQHNVIECLGDSEEDPEVDAKSGELNTTPSRNH